MSIQPKPTKKINVRQCQRCGQDHVMEFTPLTNPANEYEWWGMCPNLKEPVLLMFTPQPVES